MFTEPVIFAALRLGTYAALLALVGATGLAMRLSADLGEHSKTARPTAVRLAVSAAVALTLFRLAGLYAQTWLFFGSDDGVGFETLRVIAFETGWGAGWRVQFAAATFALAGALLVRKGVAAGWPALGVGALIAAGSQALTGHAVEGGWLDLTVFSQSLHVVGAAVWIGSLGAIFAVIVRRNSDPALTAFVIERFSPLALTAAATLAISGVVTSFTYLAAPADLLTSVYGRVLGAKILGAVVVASIGYHNWRRIKPRLQDPGAPADLRRAVAAELAVALIVLVLTAFLVALPLPAWGM